MGLIYIFFDPGDLMVELSSPIIIIQLVFRHRLQ
jgi:hypothetical protein